MVCTDVAPAGSCCTDRKTMLCAQLSQSAPSLLYGLMALQVIIRLYDTLLIACLISALFLCHACACIAWA